MARISCSQCGYEVDGGARRFGFSHCDQHQGFGRQSAAYRLDMFRLDQRDFLKRAPGLGMHRVAVSRIGDRASFHGAVGPGISLVVPNDLPIEFIRITDIVGIEEGAAA